jgi:hypothetical protein
LKFFQSRLIETFYSAIESCFKKIIIAVKIKKRHTQSVCAANMVCDALIFFEQPSMAKKAFFAVKQLF